MKPTKQLKPKNGTHFLYGVIAESGHGAWVKIGITTEILSRVRSIACGCPLPINVVWYREVGSVSLADWAEIAVHAELEPHRTSGEWFNLPWDASLRDRIDAILKRLCDASAWESVRFDESAWRNRTNRAEKLQQLADRRAKGIEDRRRESRETPFRPNGPLSEIHSIYRPQ